MNADSFKIYQSISDLPKKQREALGLISIGQDGRVHQLTAEILKIKGLIESSSQVVPGWPPITVKRYEMPIHVHIVWCNWCADKCPETEST